MLVFAANVSVHMHTDSIERRTGWSLAVDDTALPPEACYYVFMACCLSLSVFGEDASVDQNLVEENLKRHTRLVIDLCSHPLATSSSCHSPHVRFRDALQLLANDLLL